jgi:hypothetical protein
MKQLILIVVACAVLVVPQLQTDSEAAEQYACVKKNNGQFRIVDDPEDCNPSEFSVVIDVDSESEIAAEICWTNPGEDCTLRLKLKSQGTLYSIIGNETCTDDTIMIVKNAYGSGLKNNEGEIKIGLTYTGLNGDAGITHEGKIFQMDLVSGLGLIQYRESNDETECGETPVPCIVEDTYAPIDCP